MNLQIFAECLRALRQSSGLTQIELSRQLNVTPQTVSKWERGLSAPDLDNLIELSIILGVTVDALIRTDLQSTPTYIAIDGGGTKSEFLLFSEDGHILKRVVRSGTNPNSVGEDGARLNLTDGLNELLVGVKPSGVFAGIAGSMTSGNSKLIRTAIKSCTGNIPVYVDSDILNVIHSFRGVERCIAAICGTGSSVFAWDGSDLTRYGGWGYLFDRAGSGYDIGCDILRECFALNDGFGKPSLVTQLAEKQLGCPAIDKLSEFYSGKRDIIATLAPCAFEAYRKGDLVAKDIIWRNISRLAQLIIAADNGSDTVIISGGLIKQQEIIEPALKSMLPKKMRLLFPKLPQIYGAALAVLKFCNINVDAAEFDRNFTEDYNLICKEN